MKSNELKVVTLLAMIIAITSVGELGFKYMEYYQGSFIPSVLARGIALVMFWTSFVFIFVAINMYRKL